VGSRARGWEWPFDASLDERGEKDEREREGGSERERESERVGRSGRERSERDVLKEFVGGSASASDWVQTKLSIMFMCMSVKMCGSECVCVCLCTCVHTGAAVGVCVHAYNA